MPTREQYNETRRRRSQQVAVCRKCGAEKSWSEFLPCPSRRPFGLASLCIPCDRERKADAKRRQRRDAARVALRASDRARTLKSKFNITIEDYERMLNDQHGVCAICGEKESAIHFATGMQMNLAVDHCKSTGKVRSLLCGHCNKGLGLFLERKERLAAAIAYLEKHGA